MRPDRELAVEWFWDWVPSSAADAAQRAAWTGSVSRRLDEWVGGCVTAARESWPADAPQAFPFNVGEMGSSVAHDLLARAAGLAGNQSLVWGAGFLGDEVRWLPLVVLVEARRALAADEAYLMAAVGATGLDGDVREPNVEYVTTDRGAGIRVLALAHLPGEGLHGRVNAALRLPAHGDGPAPTVDLDVLLTTRVTRLDLIAVIGTGIQALMQMIDSQIAPRSGSGPLLRLTPPVEQDA